MPTYDHELLIGSTKRGFVLAHDDKGQTMFKVEEKILPFQDPLVYTQDTWSGGHGQDIAKRSDTFYEGQNIDTTVEGKVFLGPLINTVQENDDTVLDAAPVCFLWFASTAVLLCATSGKIYRYNVGANLKWTAATTTVAGVLQLVEYNGVAYAAVGASTKYYYSADGDTWTQTDLTDGYANGFAVLPNAAGTLDVLWKFKTPNEVCQTTDGRTVAAGGVQYDSPSYIGDTSNDIVQLLLINDKLFIGREDGLFHLDASGGVHPHMADLRHSRSTTNFQYSTVWQTGTYFSLGTGMGEITSYDSFDPMGPLTAIDDIGKTGTCVGLSSDKDFIYAAFDEGTDTHIYKGREQRRGDSLVWTWCPWVFLSTNACATIKVVQHSATDRRLWFGYGTQTGYVKITDNPLADSVAQFNTTGGFLRMSYTEGSDAFYDKMYQSVVTLTAGCSATKTVTPKYRKDTDTSASALTAAITSNGTVRTHLSTALACKRIQFQLDFATDASTSGPQVLYFQARGVEKPETVRTYDAVYTLGDTPQARAETVKTLLRTARTSTSLIKFADLRYEPTGTSGTAYVWVVMEPGYPREVEINKGAGKSPELGVQVKLREVTFTVS